MKYNILTVLIVVIYFSNINMIRTQSQQQSIGHDKKGWKNIWQEINEELTLEDFKENHNKILSLGAGIQLKLISESEDKFGHFHQRYSLLYKDIPIENAQIIAHFQNNKLTLLNGKTPFEFQVNTSPKLIGKDAIGIALSSFQAEKYMWEDREEEDLIKKNNRNKRTWYPEPQLLIAQNTSKHSFELVYRVDVYSKTPMDGKAIYLDAVTGEVISSFSLISKCTNGDGCTLYNGVQTVTSEKVGTVYKLLDNCRGGGIHTKFYNNEVISPDGDFTNECRTVSAHWAVEQTYDYFFNIHNRNSFDNNGAFMESRVTYDCDNAWWNGSFVVFGNGCVEANNYLVALDVAGHEWGHAVTEYSADLNPFPFSESGALNESFSDIFGTEVEFFVEGPNADYLIGEDMWVSGKLRDMTNPKSTMHSDTYMGDNWSGGDKYVRSGVQNYWFYLLAEGGVGTNDNGDNYDIQGIGRTQAAAIAYRNLTVYLTPSSTYLDARNGTLEAAEDLFGECSFEQNQTAAAWDAVGVYSAGSDDIDVCGILDINTTPKIIRARNSIRAGNVCPMGTTILSDAGITFEAKNYIELHPGFIANKNSNFLARIYCSSSSFGAYQEPMTTQSKRSESSGLSQFEKEDAATTLSIIPNPFQTSTTIAFQLEKQTEISLTVYDLAGRKIKQLATGNFDSGAHDIVWETNNQPPGVYLAKLIYGDKVQTAKLILAK